MRSALVISAFAACATCERPSLTVRAIGEGDMCAVVINGVAVSTEAELRAAAGSTGRTAFVDTDRQTPYRCVGIAVIRLQQAGIKVLRISTDGVRTH